jgi:hypothetical protein
MRENIKTLHSSEYYGTIIEIGCAAPLSNLLLKVAGASKTVFKSEQPYSKELQEERYGKFKRSVSKEFINAVLIKEAENQNINFVFASSWQLPDINVPEQYCHGYIGVYDKLRNIKHILHFTFSRENNDLPFKRYGCIDDICILSSGVAFV